MPSRPPTRSPELGQDSAAPKASSDEQTGPRPVHDGNAEGGASLPAASADELPLSSEPTPWLAGEPPGGPSTRRSSPGDTSSVQRRQAAKAPAVPEEVSSNTVFFARSSDSEAPQGPRPKSGNVLAGRFRLERPIGRGGMGSVWRGRDLKLEIDVAIKFIREGRADSTSEQRMIQEARAAARIGHPSIVRVFDFGVTEANEPFLVMELLHGESLGSLLDRERRLEPEAAVALLLPVASALVATHAKDIVHRDLKPDNVVLATDSGGAVVPKLVDFGIARLIDADAQQLSRFTETGVVLGSPHYMSPEQVRGDSDVDARADVWAFSVMLYRAVTGRLPFQGANRNAVMFAISSRTPAPITDLGVKDARLCAILRRGLSKDMAERFRSMRSLGAELAAWSVDRGLKEDVVGASIAHHWLNARQASLTNEAQPVASPRERRRVIAAGVIGILSLAMLGALAYRRSTAPRVEPLPSAVSAGGLERSAPPPAALQSAGPAAPPPAGSDGLQASPSASSSAKGAAEPPRLPSSRVKAPDIRLQR
jgi:eukaryotic-like serine/threonine-protein kinase